MLLLLNICFLLVFICGILTKDNNNSYSIKKDIHVSAVVDVVIAYMFSVCVHLQYIKLFWTYYVATDNNKKSIIRKQT